MLRLTITVGEERFNEKTNEFVPGKTHELQLEHSLVSMSKWEAKHLKPFMAKTQKTREEDLDYVRCMTLTQNVDPEVYDCLSEFNMQEIADYINSPMTATIFGNSTSKGNSREIITNELIYYWMVAQNIPFECQKWHLNRLFTLIKVCSIKNEPPKKMSKAEMLNKNRAINEARKKSLNTKG